MTNQDGDRSQDQAAGQRQGAGGHKGVPQETVGSGRKTDPNNFANDPQRAAEAGRKGGQSRGGDKG